MFYFCINYLWYLLCIYNGYSSQWMQPFQRPMQELRWRTLLCGYLGKRNSVKIFYKEEFFKFLCHWKHLWEIFASKNFVLFILRKIFISDVHVFCWKLILIYFQLGFQFYTPWKHHTDVFREYRSGTLVENGLMFSCFCSHQ